MPPASPSPIPAPSSSPALDPAFKAAFDLMEKSHEHLFVTGRAGTGKSTLLRYFQENTKKHIVTLAPTGVAALNVRGETIHSFFKFGMAPTVANIKQKRLRASSMAIYKELDAILIDEVSMVRADLLDCVDTFLRMFGPHRKLPFGGIQMIFIGDLYQLPPIVTPDEEVYFKDIYAGPYFFDAHVFKQIDVRLIELTTVYRQSDAGFVAVLDAIRRGEASEEQLAELNRRVEDMSEMGEIDSSYVYLATTNAIVQQVNDQRLRELETQGLIFKGVIKGEFNERDLPTAERLTLKPGAQVMLLNNDAQDRWVNGDIGRIVDIDRSLPTAVIVVELEATPGERAGREVEVTPYTWDRTQFALNPQTKEIETKSIGSFLQYPLKLAWAVTVHKGQGKTFERVIVDLGRGTFAHGQAYVALSRATSLEGLVLRTPLAAHHIIFDPRVKEFMESFPRKRHGLGLG